MRHDIGIGPGWGLGLSLGLGLGVALMSLQIHAHIELLDPPPRYGKELQKHGPCGDPNNGAGSGQVTQYRPGETITIKFDEFIDHRSHFRISLSVDGDQDFVDPKSFDDLNVNPAVLLDGIEDSGQGLRSVEVTLPNIECGRCTLQLMQVMYEGVFDPNRSFYYQCADIVTRFGDDPIPSNSGPGEGEGGTTEKSEEAAIEDSGATVDSSKGCRVGSPNPNFLLPSLVLLLPSILHRRRKYNSRRTDWKL